MLRSISAFAVAATVATAAASTASAAVVISATDTILAAPITNPADLLDPTSTSGAVRIDYVGTDLVAPAPNSRSPYDATAFDATAVYHSVSAGAEAIFAFGKTLSSLSFMWGSPDDYNKLDFYLGGSLVASFDGLAVIPPGTAGLGFVNTTFSGRFDEMRLRSEGADAFEITNISMQPVPLPAGVLLLGTALAGLGIAKRRKG